MRNPRATSAGPADTGACVLSLGSDTQAIPETGSRHQARAVEIDRAADFHLQLGQHRIAERLSWLAADLRTRRAEAAA